MVLPQIGSDVHFGRRSGEVVGYTTFRVDRRENYDTYLVVHLNRVSSAYLEPHDGMPHDCFVSLMIVHPQNVNVGTKEGDQSIPFGTFRAVDC